MRVAPLNFKDELPSSQTLFDECVPSCFLFLVNFLFFLFFFFFFFFCACVFVCVCQGGVEVCHHFFHTRWWRRGGGEARLNASALDVPTIDADPEAWFNTRMTWTGNSRGERSGEGRGGGARRCKS